ncbi:phage tail fiber protein [Serratia odorifera]|uniref:Uncharacterized protein n=2 Tax=Serratia odorifera TaxID=618 RepID=D4E7E0_SEROD|nr:hypothetical protein [Serratia odorifera]EFE93995.1 hypothetical protein HMPREF0758_4090 [Serratia odorifera DSM 4582]PNK89130.1 hypothetical protein CEQ31_005135 [Serratia odorifera]RII69840.1 hypothetical protein DX901_21160 [Serratia odorifera]VDZ64111.1 Uncharacterised protein [Serratia odorifera]
MSGNTITSADVIITLSVINLYPRGVQLQGFAADNIYGTDALTLAETVRGADGKLSAGFVYSNINQTFYIMPDSESRDIFDTWSTMSRASVAVFRCNATVVLPALKRQYKCVNGVLKQWKALPDAGRTLQASQAIIEWESITPEAFN